MQNFFLRSTDIFCGNLTVPNPNFLIRCKTFFLGQAYNEKNKLQKMSKKKLSSLKFLNF